MQDLLFVNTQFESAVSEKQSISLSEKWMVTSFDKLAEMPLTTANEKATTLWPKRAIS